MNIMDNNKDKDKDGEHLSISMSPKGGSYVHHNSNQIKHRSGSSSSTSSKYRSVPPVSIQSPSPQITPKKTGKKTGPSLKLPPLSSPSLLQSQEDETSSEDIIVIKMNTAWVFILITMMSSEEVSSSWL
eukprot:TRINITY_DN7582_c0_g2_i1.p2 TRINITY_DN7582_c0_g2~~TRINITY_DN7582_c0_g2_i1.p2  ORF type:complete len:129 (-),score=34.89 TRINITY_DN7582_c0_g2_i1:483-869(-)